MTDKQKITISLDCFGGDNGARPVIDGMVRFLSKNKAEDVQFLLYGDENLIKNELKKYKNYESFYTIIHTTKKIDSDAKPSVALRHSIGSSMYMAIDAVKNNEADACVSAGNTGALMAISKLVLRPLQDIDRPALIQLLPTQNNKSVAMLDLGANIECSSENLYQFAVMGRVFYEVMTGEENPRIGLLNIGSEDIKGNEVIKNTATILKESVLKDDFYGFVEGNDIFKEKVDVIVADGFTGNIALKTLEGTAKFVSQKIKDMMKSCPILSQLGMLFLLPSLLKLKKKINPENYNGALFIGLNGISIKSHGNATGKSFECAIKNAVRAVRGDINNKIIKILKKEIEEE